MINFGRLHFNYDSAAFTTKVCFHRLRTPREELQSFPFPKILFTLQNHPISCKMKFCGQIWHLSNKVLGFTALQAFHCYFWVLYSTQKYTPPNSEIIRTLYFLQFQLCYARIFFSFQNRRFLIWISFSFWIKGKPSVLKLKLKVFMKLENRSML